MIYEYMLTKFNIMAVKVLRAVPYDDDVAQKTLSNHNILPRA